MTTKNYYSAARIYRGPTAKAEWYGWVQFNGEGPTTRTPDTYSTKREALAAIKAQHPESKA